MTAFPLADAIAGAIADDAEALREGRPCALLDQVTPITSELLRWWFDQDSIDNRPFLNFHEGQRAAILAVVYAHEVLGVTSLSDLYEQLAPAEALAPGMFAELTTPRNRHPKYAAKMATGTGKTWVLNALLVWQYLNAVAAPGDARFTSNFLIVAPGLIVYDRLLDSFEGRVGPGGLRDPSTSDLAQQSDLFVPPSHRAAVQAFVASSVVEKQDIGRKVTGGGCIVITNWQRLMGARDEDPDFLDLPDEDEEAAVAPGADIDASAAARSFVPLTPGVNAGNSLETLDRRWSAGGPLDWLTSLPSLLVFNDEAHHVHSGGRGDDATEVEWQRTLDVLAEGKGRAFTQIDFSATPYNESRGRRRYFHHIVVDFDLLRAIQLGLVKQLALDKRQEVAAIPNSELEFRALRDENGRPSLSEGQRTMLRAGLRRLEILEEEFTQHDPDKHPKLLVMVEDTTVSPLVGEFLEESGFGKDDYLQIDSGVKADLTAEKWAAARTRLFDIDAHREPRVIISVLMLREGFDVNSICVIVPLRKAGSGILAEQTVGRGLRLMWRGDEQLEELKRENRERMRRRQAPKSFFDVLFVVEHPRFADLYEEISDGITEVSESDDGTRITGDAERVDLRPGFELYDFSIPFIRRDPAEELIAPRVDIQSLPVSKYPVQDFLRSTPRGDQFSAEDYETRTRFGPYTVDGAKLTARGYNEWLGKLANRVGGAVGRAFTSRGNLIQRSISSRPDADYLGSLQVSQAQLVRWADTYIRTRWAGRRFDPFADESWRVLMVDDIADEIAGALASALAGSLDNAIVSEPDVIHRKLSEVSSIVVRRGSGVDVDKCIYPRLPIPSRAGGLERAFIEWAEQDSAVEAFVKIHEYRHDFLRRPYLKANGMPGLYSPDFLVRTAGEVYVVETKAQSALTDADVQRKQRAALGWVTQINALPEELRSTRTWHYVLLGEKTAREWMAKNATVTTALGFARLQPLRRPDGDTLPGF